MSRELDMVTKTKLTLTKYTTLRDLKSLVLVNEYNEKSINFSRTLIWKLPTLFSDAQYQDLPITDLINSQSPHLHKELLAPRLKIDKFFKDLEIPWHQLPRDSEYYQELTELDIGTRHRATIDPLSVPNTDDDKFHLELIILDVERLFPQLPALFVDNFDNKKLLVECLFLTYKDLGLYRQGMHELMGIVFVALHEEVLKSNCKRNYSEPLELDIFPFYDIANFQKDLYIVFDKLVKPLLERFFTETNLLQESIKFNLKLHELDKMLYHVLITKLKIQTPIWILRFLRLGLLRELGIPKTLLIWDKLIAFDGADISKLLPFFIVLMLLRIRNFILASENDEVLYLLLHYPEEKVSNITVLIQDLILLYNSDTNLASLSKIMVYKYCREDADGNEMGQLKRVISLKRKKNKSLDLNSYEKNIDDSIGGNNIDTSISRDFERTRLEMRLKKKVGDMMKRN